MLTNKRYAPGVLPASHEQSYNATKIAKNLFLYVEYIGHSYVSPEYAVMRSHYCHYLLMYIVSGHIIYQTQGHTEEARAGQAFLIETQRPHIYGSIGNTEILWIHFNGTGFHSTYEYLISSNHDNHTFELHGNPEFVKKLTDLFLSYSSAKLYPEIEVSSKLYDLMSSLVVYRNPSMPDTIDSSIRYISNHYSEPLTLDILARQANLSISRFSTLFKQKTGYTPHQYLLNTRLHASRQLLASSAYSVNYIALYTGFSDASYFISAFRKKYGCTPVQYRMQLSQQ